MKGKLIITSELVGVGCSFAICDRLLGESFFSFFAFLAQDSFDFRYFFPDYYELDITFIVRGERQTNT